MNQTTSIGMGPIPQEKATKLLVLDLDGTVRYGLEQLGRFVNHSDDVVIFPEAVEQMRRWKAAGGRIIGVSNQGGLALGFFSFDVCAGAIATTDILTDHLFDKISICRHHPDAVDPEYAHCWCRKPSPGLLIEAALSLGHRYNEFYPPYMGLFVGDRPEDHDCAKLSGFPFKWARDWRQEINPGCL